MVHGAIIIHCFYISSYLGSLNDLNCYLEECFNFGLGVFLTNVCTSFGLALLFDLLLPLLQHAFVVRGRWVVAPSRFTLLQILLKLYQVMW